MDRERIWDQIHTARYIQTFKETKNKKESRRVWKGFAIKPIVKTQLKFKYRYLYKAVNPKTGESFSLIMSSINTDNMNRFLEEFKKFLGDKEVILIMDNASFHKSKRLKIQKE